MGYQGSSPPLHPTGLRPLPGRVKKTQEDGPIGDDAATIERETKQITDMDKKKIQASRKAALTKIKEYLSAPDIEGQFEDKNGDYYSKDRFLVTWLGFYNTMASEFRIDKCDGFYSSFSGYKAIYAAVGLFHEKQLAGYHTFERALIDVGLKLCPNHKQKVAFFNQFAKPYNERLLREKQQKQI